METWRYVVVVGAAIGQFLFIVLYMTAPWWRTYVGVALFMKSLSLGILVVTLAVTIIRHDRLPEKVTLILYALVAISIWYQFFALVRRRFIDRKKNEG